MTTDLTSMLCSCPNTFFAKGYYATANPGDPVDYLLRTPANIDVHWAYLFQVDSDHIFTVYQDPTIADPGTPVTYKPMNLQNENPGLMLAYAAPTVTDTGSDVVLSSRMGSLKSTGSISSGYLITSKKDTYYLMRMSKVAAGTGYVDYDFFWIEDQT